MQTIMKTFKREGRTKSSKFHRGITRSLDLIALPTIIYFLIFSYMPMIGIIIAFKDYTYTGGIFGSEWVGFENFVFLFSGDDAIRLFRNTILYNIVFIITMMAGAIGVALLLDTLSSRKAIKVYQTSMFLPHFLSWVIVAFIARGLFNYESGLFNQLLVSLGFDRFSWYTETKPWPFILTFAQLWKSIGYQALIYYGAIIGIDSSIYEAAEIDGATKWQVTRHIKIPLIRSTMTIMFIMAIGGILSSDFGMFYYLPNNEGPLYPVTDVFSTYIFRTLNVLGDVQSSSAASVFTSVVGFFLVIISNWIVRKVEPENAMF